ncbi:DUF1275 domain-containing protein [Skermania sp. ID1734]|uniref:YoaK family protein n=1 Tax=Skermania sp. ID1734 TaxID=2597516 RepID=UPI00117CCE1E|nr:YoaK family protein [Skermania sp. ID1734]TSE00104.1 DUF1275 domain-containing protein [Skermania sp. ID1734]
MRDEQVMRHWPVLVAAVLTFGTAALDLVTLTMLGGVFASVMTGNLVLTGMGFAHADTTLIAHTAVGFAGYITGAGVGSRLTGARDADMNRWPLSTTISLALEVVLLVVVAVLWEVTGAAPTGAAQLVLLALAACAMGLQSAAMRGLGVTIATTYLTGTLTAIVASAVSRHRLDRPGIAAVAAAICGATASGLLLRAAPAAIPVLTTIPALSIALAAANRHRRVAAANRRPPTPATQPVDE